MVPVGAVLFAAAGRGCGGVEITRKRAAVLFLSIKIVITTFLFKKERAPGARYPIKPRNRVCLPPSHPTLTMSAAPAHTAAGADVPLSAFTRTAAASALAAHRRRLVEYLYTTSCTSDHVPRSVTRVVDAGDAALPLVRVAIGTAAPLFLKPRAAFADPFKGDDAVIVVCDAHSPPDVASGAAVLAPHPTNTRTVCDAACVGAADEEPLLAVTQQYTIVARGGGGCGECLGVECAQRTDRVGGRPSMGDLVSPRVSRRRGSPSRRPAIHVHKRPQRAPTFDTPFSSFIRRLCNTHPSRHHGRPPDNLPRGRPGHDGVPPRIQTGPVLVFDRTTAPFRLGGPTGRRALPFDARRRPSGRGRRV